MKAIIDAVFAEGAMLVAVLADVCLFVGVVGPGWGVPRDPDNAPIYSLSLWKTCDRPIPITGYVKCWGLPAMPGWFTAVQALVMTSLVGLLLSLFVVSLFTCGCWSRFKEDRRLLLVYCIATLVFSIIGVVGVVLFGIHIGDLRVIIKGTEEVIWTVSWSFVMTAIGACSNFLCVILVFVELIIGPRRMMTSSDTAPVIAYVADIATS